MHGKSGEDSQSISKCANGKLGETTRPKNFYMPPMHKGPGKGGKQLTNCELQLLEPVAISARRAVVEAVSRRETESAHAVSSRAAAQQV